MCGDYNKAELSNNFNVLTVLVHLAFLIQPVYSSGDSSQSISLDDSGNPLHIVNVRRASPNFCNFSGYLSPPTPAMVSNIFITEY